MVRLVTSVRKPPSEPKVRTTGPESLDRPVADDVDVPLLRPGRSGCDQEGHQAHLDEPPTPPQISTAHDLLP